MNPPSIAIVGRANVGKSTLFNVLCGKRIAIVDPSPGVTRDRIAHETTIDGRACELVDTGGVSMESAAEIAADVDTQIQIAIEQADLVLFVVDAHAGSQPLDGDIARRLREAGKQVIIVANKAERESDAESALDFFELGMGEPIRVSATQRLGLGTLRARIVESLPPAEQAPHGPEPVKLAFVGRRNVGKSTLINFLAQAPRVVVSELPGTTRDSVDVRFQAGDLDFIAIDTAGVRKKRQVSESVDFYSQVRTEEAIERADVVVLLLEAPSHMGAVDKQLADHVTAACKPCVFAVNKMDLVREKATENDFREYIRWHLPGLRYAPVIGMSAKTGDNVFKLVEAAHALYQQSRTRMKTGELNRAVSASVRQQRPPSHTQHLGNVLYATQTAVQPPTIALFVNHSTVITEEYERYLANQLRDVCPFPNVPIRFLIRRRGKPQEP